MARLVCVVLTVLALSACTTTAPPPVDADPETRIVNYLKENVKPGKPVIVADLMNVFQSPEEQKVLNRLFNTFFKVPITIVQLHARTNKIPTLEELSQQFDFQVPGEMDVILRIMESDPRIPPFLVRDPNTGEITNLDVDLIKADPNFGRLVERSIAGLEGLQAPGFSIPSFTGSTLDSSQFKGHPHLIYFWFTNCPPCVQTTPMLVKLYEQYSAKGFRIVAVNADRVLELPYDDATRTSYVSAQGIKFDTAHLTHEMQQAYGGITLFPTMFFVNAEGKIVKHLVSFHPEATLEEAIQQTLK